MTEQYPTEADVESIKTWPYADPIGWFDFIKDRWTYADCGWKQDGRNYSISTAGWSGNEELICAMQSNFILWSQCWKVHRTGGHYRFEIPKRYGGSEMTKDELNRRISEKREPLILAEAAFVKVYGDEVYIDPIPSPKGAWFRVCNFENGDKPEIHPKDWHSPANAMTLLKEMQPYFNLKRFIGGWQIWWPTPGSDMPNEVVANEDLESAICEGWLLGVIEAWDKWKEHK